MKIASIFSEAWRNFSSGTTRALLFTLISICIIVGLGVFELTTVAKIIEKTNQFRSSGSAITSVYAKDGIDGNTCNALKDTLSVRKAGAFRESKPLHALSMPNSSISVWEGTPNLVELIAPTATLPQRSQGFWLTPDLAETLGVRPGNELFTATGTGHISGIFDYPEDGRQRTLGFSAVSVVPADGVFNYCWAEIWPKDPVSEELILSAVIAGTDPSIVEVTQLNVQLGTEIKSDELFTERITRHFSAAALALGMFLGFAAVWFRRLEIAAALHAQINKASMMLQLAVETMFWTLPAVLTSAVVLFAFALTQNVSNPSGLWLLSLPIIGAAACGSFLGCVLASSFIREQRLVRYFKDR